MTASINPTVEPTCANHCAELSPRLHNAADAGLAHLAGLTNLEVLSLDHTLITDAGLGHLEAMRSLNELDLRGTQVTDAACDRLEAALPNLRIQKASGTLP